MEENIAELSRKYREEMLRLYGTRQTSAPVTGPETAEQAPVPEAEPAALPQPEPEAPTEETPPPEPESQPEELSGDYEEPVLPDYIQPEPPPLPSDWTAQEEYEKYNTAEGRLRVIAATARSAYPVAGARVMVYTRIGGKDYLSYVLTTDISGETPTVTLPAPPASLSQEPENEAPYAVCDIDIFATGFFHSEARNVHIFAGVTTRQVFQLVPLPLHFSSADQMEFNPDGQLEEVR